MHAAEHTNTTLKITLALLSIAANCADVSLTGCKGVFTRFNVELSGSQRRDARARAVKVPLAPQVGPWWPAVGAPLERVVRAHSVDSGNQTVGVK